MISVIGFGDFCESIANKLKTYSQYNVYKLPKVPALKNAEEYERANIDLTNIITDSNSGITVFVDGSEAISGIILKFLETVKTRDIHIIYIRSDLQLLSNIEKLQDKVCFNILQQYARSGLFKKLILVDKLKLEQIIGNLTILDYEEKLTSMIASTYHMSNVYEHTKPILTNSIEIHEVCRIMTLGLSGIGKNDINWFFDLNNINEIIYYFAINSNTLKKEQNLLANLKKQIKDKQAENTKVMFGVYETQYPENYVYCVATTKIIQQETTA